MWSQTSLRRVLMTRSQCAFIFGAWGGQDIHVVGLEDGIEGSRVLAVAIAEQKPELAQSPIDVGDEVASLLCRPVLGRMGGHAGDVQPPCAVFEEHQGIEVLPSAVSMWKRSAAMMPRAWLVRNCFRVGPARGGTGPTPAECRIFHTVEAAIRCPSPVSSPWILL
jgi:hypothetical protein